ncbi:hypothetical protein [Thioalkalivibrio sp. HK1]|uniref:hypothetical protein n=1 Tax=Thioalkalivibrio sp. HK1 TaxID=1469245 RepID=UPI000470308F|nr:hypothetical protein [Thioalkalivibrio sp. HK1]
MRLDDADDAPAGSHVGPQVGHKDPLFEPEALGLPSIPAVRPLKRGDFSELSSSMLALDLLVPGLLGPIGRIIEGEVGRFGGSASEDRSAVQAFCAELDAGDLDRLLDRCRYSKDLEDIGEDEPEPSLESRIFRTLGWTAPRAGHDWPVAAVTATLDRPNPSKRLEGEAFERQAAARPFPQDRDQTEGRDRAWLRADPVHLLAGVGDLVLSDPRSMDAASPDALDRAEADALARVINDALEPQGPFIVAADPLRWYIALDAFLRIETSPPSTAIGKTVFSRLPRGSDAPFWHGWSNLVQMALHECPTNIARIERKKLPINSLWLWGGGYLPPANEIPPKEFECVWSDDALVCALARLPDVRADVRRNGRGIEPDSSDPSPPPARVGEASDIVCRAAPCDAADWLVRAKSEGTRSGRHLIVHDRLFSCAKRSDPQRWREGIEDFSAKWAKPLFDELRLGALDRLSIIDEYGHRFTATASSASQRRWWPGQKRGLAGAMVDALSTHRDRINPPDGERIARRADRDRSDR